MRILAIGDFHYPDRASYPKKIFEVLKGEKFDLILCTGDLTDLKVLDDLESLGTVKIVQGNMDWNFGHPDRIIEKINGIKIGLIHGSQIRPRGDLKKLCDYAKRLNVDILISGHTHAQSVNICDNNKLLINPGSATGAWSFLADRIPSFIIIETDNEIIKIIKCQLKTQSLHREILEYKKSFFK